jgi:hypothetical protein
VKIPPFSLFGTGNQFGDGQIDRVCNNCERGYFRDLSAVASMEEELHNVFRILNKGACNE